ncbi:MAG: hypothetical protein ACLFN8_02245 [Candidatus Woesearchaeota archaeon]
MRIEDTAPRSAQEKSKKLLFDALKNKTSYYLNKPVLEDTDLYYYVKDFFREYLNLNREISFEEIKNELDKTYITKDVKESIKTFINKISEVEYKDSTFEEEKVKDFIQEFYDLAKQMQYAKKKKKSPLTRLLAKIGFGKKIKNEKKEIDEANKDKNTTPQDVQIQEKEYNKQLAQNKPIQTQTTPLPQDQLLQQTQRKEEITNDFKDNPNSEQETQVTTQEKEREEYGEIPIHNEKKQNDKLKNIPLSNDFTQEINLNNEKPNSDWHEDVNPTKKQTKDTKSKIDDLIKKANETKDKKELFKLYKEINTLYEKENVQIRAKIYPDLMKIYKKLTKK